MSTQLKGTTHNELKLYPSCIKLSSPPQIPTWIPGKRDDLADSKNQVPEFAMVESAMEGSVLAEKS